MRKDYSQFTFSTDKVNQSLKDKKLHKLIIERGQASEGETIQKGKNLPPPSSPLRIKNDSRNYNYTRLDSSVSQEDEEVSSIVMKGESVKRQLVRCDSVVHDDCK